MAFLDETGLAELWELIKTEDAKNAKIATGHYAGTGNYGASNPCSLTFGFKPRIIWIYAYEQTSAGGSPKAISAPTYGTNIVDVSALGTSFVYGRGVLNNNNNSAGSYARMSEDGKTYYWYNASASYQLNASGYTYFYIAIG